MAEELAHSLNAIEHRYAVERQGSGVPAGPFVAKTEAWVGLVLKRMIRYAAEEGFDRVAWTTGAQQAERYDLSKQIDFVTVKPTKTSNEVLLTAVKDNKIVIPQGAGELRVHRDKLEDYIGKEMAEKALKEIDQTGEQAQFSGLDVKVGGEGMRAFYDRRL